MTTTTPPRRINEYAHLKRLVQELKDVLERESKRPEGYEDLDFATRDLIEYEIIPALEEQIDYDPTPQHLYDHSGGEPPMTTAEIWMDAHRTAQLLKS
jgi:hypothetical protein